MGRSWWLGVLLAFGVACPVEVDFGDDPAIANECGEETCGAGQICVHQEDCIAGPCGFGFEARADGSFCTYVPEPCASISDADCVIAALCPAVGEFGDFGDAQLVDGNLECAEVTGRPSCGCSRQSGPTKCGDYTCDDDEICLLESSCDADLCESRSDATVEILSCVPIPKPCEFSLDPACIIPASCGADGVADGSTFVDDRLTCAWTLDRTCDCEPPTWPAVECGSVTCRDGEVCVEPPLGCNYSPCGYGENAEFTRGPGRCAPRPSACELGVGLSSCLQDELCPANNTSSGQFSAGTLTCGGGALDCFC